MAIAFDSSSGGDGSTTITVSHTITGSNPVLVVGIYLNTSRVVSSVTWNGGAMTQLNTANNGGDNWYMYYKAAPGTGTHDVVMTADGAGNHEVRVASYTGVNQVTPFDTNLAQKSASGLTQNYTLSSTVDNCWLIEYVRGTQSNPTAGAGTTIRSTGGGGASSAMFDSNGALSTGSNTLVTNQSPSGFVYQAGGYLQIASAAVANGNFLALF